jgi:lipoprotein-anchoring transpeptidase ErfK/SrfK
VQRQVLPPGDFPEGVPLGRGALGWGAPILSRPHPEGTLLGHVYPNDVVRIARTVVGLGMAYHSHLWFELEDGFVYAPNIQPVWHLPQPAVTSIPAEGLWAEVVTPVIVAPTQHYPVQPDRKFDLIYSMVMRLSELYTGADGSPWYRATTEMGLTVDAPASVFRIIHDDELTPLSPEVDPAEKRITVYLAEQALSAFEGEREVFRTRISSGANYFGEDGVTVLNGTPIGRKYIWSKRISRQMIGGTLETGYDVPGIGWVTYFAGDGAAIHSTYWHNNYGLPQSHGCLNCRASLAWTPLTSPWAWRSSPAWPPLFRRACFPWCPPMWAT